MHLKFVPYQRKPLVSPPKTHQKGREEVDFFNELLPVTPWPIFYSMINLSHLTLNSPFYGPPPPSSHSPSSGVWGWTW